MAEQRQFPEQSVAGLPQVGKVICVRLDFFADMIEGRPWTLTSLKVVGGEEGVGIAFLGEQRGGAKGDR